MTPNAIVVYANGEWMVARQSLCGLFYDTYRAYDTYQEAEADARLLNASF